MQFPSRMVVLAFVLAAMLPALAGAVVQVRAAEQLVYDRGVRKAVVVYRALAAANVMYDQCGDAYSLTQEKRDYLNTLFIEASDAYSKAFYNAYVAKVGAKPEQWVIDDYTRLMLEQQQKVVNNTAISIQKSGCRDKALSYVIAYPENYRRSQPGS